MKSQPDLFRPRPPRRRSPSKVSIDAPPPPPAQDELALGAVLGLLRDNARLILAVAFGFALLAAVYALVARPAYEATMLIHVEEVNPSSAKNALNELSSMFETKKAATAEMELLRSRAVVAPAVERLKLYIEARPRVFPVLGPLLRIARPGRLSQPGLFGFGGYVWGAEQIEVAQFTVPAAMLNREFVITSMGGQRFSVYEPASNIMFYGTIGPLLRAETEAGPVELQVSRLDARAGARFFATRHATMAAIRKLQRDLVVAEQGKQSGVIEVRLEGPSAELVNETLREIGQQYMAQNFARKSEEAEQSLAFLDRQLPKLKAKLEGTESAYNRFRNANGTVDFAEEAKLSLQQATAAKLRRAELQQKREELLTRFTVRHPMVVAVNGQLRQVEQELADVAQHIKTLPQLEQDAQRLSREMKIDTDLYTALANTAQQLRIVSVGKTSNVRMVDAPMVSDEPVRPHRALLVTVGVAGGLLLGVVAAVLRRSVLGGVEDPAHIEQLLGSRVVFASIPHSAAQARLSRRGGRGERQPLLALDWPTDGAVEALRSFRASLQFSMPRFDNNVVMIAGPTSGLGKSFVTANFAAVMAASGKRVLLVDADVRNGRLHRLFGAGREHGLCEAITGAVPIGEVIRREVLANLDFIPTGCVNARRPDLFMHIDVGVLLESVRAQYDLVLVDSPPVLALADSLVIGRHAGAVFLVARAGVSTEREITEAIKRLNQAGVSPAGILFNDVKPRLSGYGYKYGEAYGAANLARLEYAAPAAAAVT
jgi:tyrosine-protein kinase Etk/Wzc